jgi:hypothetical protein
MVLDWSGFLVWSIGPICDESLWSFGKIVRQPLFSRLQGNRVFGFWQGCEAIIWVEWFTRSISPINELIFGLGL